MKLSVVIPTLNRLEYLKVTLRDLLPQIERNLEYVDFQISINATLDNTKEYIQNLAIEFPFIQYKLFNNRVDICESFSRSIDLCQGEYVLIFGDDDIPAPFMIESILQILNNGTNSALIHFNRLVGSDLELCSLNKLRIEHKEYSSSIKFFELSDFIDEYTISPGFISSMVFKKESWILGNYLNTTSHYGYEFLSRIYAGIYRLENKTCIYLCYPLVIQRLVKTRDWNDRWPKYWLLGVPNLLQSLDQEGISKNAINVWHRNLNYSWLKLIYTLLWASTHKNIYKPLVRSIQKHQNSILRKVSVFFIINLTPGFVFKQLRKVLYK